MIYSKEIPPIFSRIKEVFKVSWDKGIAIAYGDTVYSINSLPPDIVVHEQVHLDQQMNYGKDVKMDIEISDLNRVAMWWDRYLTDKEFRLSQEIEAYKVQAKFLRESDTVPANYRKWKLEEIVKQLSSSVYGNIISYQEAKKLL